MKANNPDNVDEYISQFDGEVKERLIQFRSLILEEAPNAVESISYGMPAYKLSGKPLAYFAGYNHHVGFYAMPTTHETFKSALSKYKTGKGSVQFPNDQPFPTDLIKEMLHYRMQNL